MSNRELPMMPWYPDQFAASTRSFSLLERAIYRELLDAQWQASLLPSNEKLLARIVGLDVRTFRKYWPAVRAKFVTLPDGSIQNVRLEKHRLAASERRNKLVESGRLGGQASVKHRLNGSSSHDQATAQASPQGSVNTPTLSPTLKEEEHPPTPLKGGDFGNGERKPRESRNGSLKTWRTLLPLVDHVRSTAGLKDALTWRYVQEHVDPLVWKAIERSGGCLALAERDRFTTSELEARFREAYENLREGPPP